MQPLYGEGTRSFTRLQEILLVDKSFDESLFAWQSGVPLKCLGWDSTWAADEWGLLAPSPDCFKSSLDIEHSQPAPRLGGGFQISSQGVTIALPLKETKSMWGIDRKEIGFPLHCKRNGKTIVLQLRREMKKSPIWRRTTCNAPLVADGKAKVGNNRVTGIDQLYTDPVTVGNMYLKS